MKTAGVRIGYFGHYSIYHNEKQLKSRKTLRDYNLLHGGQVFEIMAIDEEEDRGHPPSNGLTNAKIEVWNSTSGYSYKDIQCFQVCYIQGLPHVQTSYGCYEVDHDFLMHNNILYMCETDSDEDKEDDEKKEKPKIDETPPMSDDDVFQPTPPKDEDMRTVQVKNFASRDVMMNGKIDGRMKLKGLLNFMMEFENIKEEQKDQLIFTDSHGKAYSWSLTVQQCVDTTTFDGFYLKVSGLSGGALVRGHLTKQQMLDRFKKKSRDYIKQLKSIDDEDDESVYDGSLVPQSIHDFMEEKRQQIANASFMASQGRCPILMALTSTPDDKLLTIQNIMQAKFHGKKDCSELRVVKSINLMFPTMAVIEQTKMGLTLLQKELSTSLMMLYANRFNEEFGGEVRYCHAGFLKALNEELIKRQVRPMAEPERGCTLS